MKFLSNTMRRLLPFHFLLSSTSAGFFAYTPVMQKSNLLRRPDKNDYGLNFLVFQLFLIDCKVTNYVHLQFYNE